MKLSDWIKVFCAIGAFALVTLAQSDWKTYVSKEGGFEVSMPARPQESEAPLDLGEYHAVAHTTNVVFEGVNYVVTYSDLPVDSNDTAISKSVFDGVRRSLLARPTAKLLNEKDIELDGHHGHEIEVQLSSAIALTRMFVVKNRTYQLIAVFKGDKTPDAALKFLDSFKFVNDSGLTYYNFVLN